MSLLALQRPLVVFDLETTGLDLERDRIVEIATLKLLPDGGRDARRHLIDPGIPIPPQATAVHGIGDADVRGAPRFRQIARSFLDWLGDADLAGFNIQRYDAPLLDRELRECGLDLGLAGRKLVDAMTIFKRKERRNLEAAVAFFLGREHVGAHSAVADVEATADVLEAELARYTDLPRDVPGLDRWLRNVPENAVDADGRFVWDGDEPAFSFGKHRGRRLSDVIREERDYVDWLLQTDFPAEAREVILRALGTPGQST